MCFDDIFIKKYTLYFHSPHSVNVWGLSIKTSFFFFCGCPTASVTHTLIAIVLIIFNVYISNLTYYVREKWALGQFIYIHNWISTVNVWRQSCLQTGGPRSFLLTVELNDISTFLNTKTPKWSLPINNMRRLMIISITGGCRSHDAAIRRLQNRFFLSGLCSAAHLDQVKWL